MKCVVYLNEDVIILLVGFEDFPPLESDEAREVLLLTMLFLLIDDLIRSIMAQIHHT